MSVQVYSMKTDANVNLAKNFKVREFACKDGSDRVLIDTMLVEKLQKLRDLVGKPIIINSAYRTASHNKKVGGSPTSQHLYGRAADIKVKNVKPIKVFELAKQVGFNGVGLYDTFVHVDVRPYKTYFDYRTKK